MTGPVPPTPAPTLPPGLVRAPARAARKGPRSRRPFVIVAAVVVVVVIAVAAVLLLKGSGLKTGSGTATISWKAHGVGTTSQSLTGTVDGLTLVATSRSTSTGSTGSAPAAGGQPAGTTGAALPVAHWSGTLGGTTFDLAVTETFGTGTSSSTDNKYLGNFNITYRITGTYGSDAVKGTATADPGHAGRLQFHGTIGKYHVKGTASEPKKGATSGKFRASFIVTG